MASNYAAWLTGERVWPFEVKEAPKWTPSEDEILVKNHALAVQPVDGYIQALAFFPMKYPTILGNDVAGEVVEVGAKAAKRFKKGDRVLGQATGVVSGKIASSGFQNYTILQSHMAAAIPDGMPYEKAVVIPCCFSTSASAMFSEPPFLNMQWPTEPKRSSTGQTVLIWGGSSSVGSNAIQLAAAAGYEVVTTASSKNAEYCKALGASECFDHRDEDVNDQILRSLKGKTVAGALDCIGGPAVTACLDIISKSDGNQAVVTVKLEPKEGVPEGVTVKHVMGAMLKDTALGPAMYEGFLPKALESGNFVPAPKPQIVGNGLEKVQDMVDHIQKGVSATKLVVLL